MKMSRITHSQNQLQVWIPENPHKLFGARLMGVNVLGIDTGQKCGMCVINSREHNEATACVSLLAYCDASGFDRHVDQIAVVGSNLQELLRYYQLSNFQLAIESPVVAPKPNASTILQARMFQHLIDVIDERHYYVGFSEVNPASSRSAGLRKGDPTKGKKVKVAIVKNMSERFGIDLMRLVEGCASDRAVVAQAVADSMTVALAFMKKVRLANEEGDPREGPQP